jgi:hypothetical protein
LEEEMSFSKEEKAMWLEDWKQSGKKAWTYAKENGLIPQTFCSWVKRGSLKASGFVEIPVQIKPKPEQVILIEKGGIKIHIPMSVWIEYPAAVMEGLRVLL